LRGLGWPGRHKLPPTWRRVRQVLTRERRSPATYCNSFFPILLRDQNHRTRRAPGLRGQQRHPRCTRPICCRAARGPPARVRVCVCVRLCVHTECTRPHRRVVTIDRRPHANLRTIDTFRYQRINWKWNGTCVRVCVCATRPTCAGTGIAGASFD
jgi:hypothetical protein